MNRIYFAIISIIVLLGTGTIMYHHLEGWSYIDAFYFSGMTITTVGYGDLVPVTTTGKLFTVLFSLLGVGGALFALSIIAAHYFEHHERALFQQLNRAKRLLTRNQTLLKKEVEENFDEIRKVSRKVSKSKR